MCSLSGKICCCSSFSDVNFCCVEHQKLNSMYLLVAKNSGVDISKPGQNLIYLHGKIPRGKLENYCLKSGKHFSVSPQINNWSAVLKVCRIARRDRKKDKKDNN